MLSVLAKTTEVLKQRVTWHLIFILKSKLVGRLYLMVTCLLLQVAKTREYACTHDVPLRQGGLVYLTS